MHRRDNPTRRPRQTCIRAYARPSLLLLATAVLSILLCLAIIASTLYSLQTHRERALVIAGLFTIAWTSALAIHHYRSVFRRRPSSAQAATTIYALIILLAAIGCVFNLRDPLQLLIWLAIGVYAAWSGHLQSRWARTIACPLPGLCRNCGYNLTGNITGICPECGTPCPPKARRYIAPSPEDLS